MQNMKAQLIARERHILQASAFVEILLWQVPRPVPPCTHPYKYSLVYIVDGVRAVGFDNERGKGDHYHFGSHEYPYVFHDIAVLLADFDTAVARWNHGYRSA